MLVWNYGSFILFYFFVRICDSYEAWKYLASCFRKIVFVNRDES